ncbi:MAG: DUF4167 domain-containing protein [Alphaproteobacteria bacterium]|nr:DUF4167 domain-containing protein [Alphaproteobacteria bacterium]
MRQNQAQNQKRSRGRGRRTGGYGQTNINRNTTFESNGPEGRLRGNAQQLYEKYTALANDANTAGERISAEACSQFADHYYRINQTIVMAAEQQRRTQDEQRASRRPVHASAEDASAGDAPAPDEQSSEASSSDESSSDESSSNKTSSNEKPSGEKPPHKVAARRQPAKGPEDEDSSEAVA